MMTAAGHVGHEQLFYVPLPALAQYVAELVARLPADVLRPLADALRARLDAPAA